MNYYVFTLRYSVEDDGTSIIVRAVSLRRAYDRLDKLYGNCPNIEYIGVAGMLLQ